MGNIFSPSRLVGQPAKSAFKMVPPILGSEVFRKGWTSIGGRLKRLAKGLVKDGIGDKMDRGNLWIVPGFTLLVFACLWCTKLSKIALDESSCRLGGSHYEFGGTLLDEDAQRHCQTAKRYYVAPEEPFHYEQRWREEREVKNPEWILWFWAPIVFVMYVLTRFLWSLLLESQGINFNNVVNASQNVLMDNDGVVEVDEDKLQDRVGTIADNFKVATYSRAFAGFIAFELSLVMAPIVLLMFVLPLMIGAGYRTWGLDVARAWWDRKEWHGTTLTPLLGEDGHYYSPFGMHTRELRDWERHPPRLPLIPRITYCDYNYVTLGNSHTLTYRCYLDANWHERTALFTWVMLGFLTVVNLGNLFFWLEWAFRMKFKKARRKWVLRKWLCDKDDFSPWEQDQMKKFAEQFRTGNLLLFYYIEAHTDRVVASAFCVALFRQWLLKRKGHWVPRPRGSGGGGDGGDSPSGFITPRVGFTGAVPGDYGWNLHGSEDAEEGDVSSPASPQYYSAESPTTLPLLKSPVHPHRMSASSDSSTSKSPGEMQLDELKPKFSSTPKPTDPQQQAMMSMMGPSGASMGGTATPRSHYQPYPVPRSRGTNYSRNITKDNSRDPLMSGGGGSSSKGGSASKDRRKKEKERDKRAQRNNRGGPDDEREREDNGGRSRCTIM